MFFRFGLLMTLIFPVFLSANNIYFPFEEEVIASFHFLDDKDNKITYSVYIEGHWYKIENLKHYDSFCQHLHCND